MVHERSNEGVPWSRPTSDPWVGSRRVVAVRPHLWRWLAASVDGLPVLEVGPGLRPTAAVGTSYFVDRSPHALRQLAARGGKVAQAEAELGFPDGFFGAVLAFEVLEHVEADGALLREIARVLRPGGTLMLSVPIRPSLWTPLDDACGHVRRYEPEELFAKLRAAGIEPGGYAWAAAGPAAVERLRARVLLADRRHTTAIVQNLVFPLQSAFERAFGRVRWDPPDVPVPARAEHLTAWARSPGDRAPA
jgi:SAM-dependent methyltransferase